MGEGELVFMCVGAPAGDEDIGHAVAVDADVSPETSTTGPLEALFSTRHLSFSLSSCLLTSGRHSLLSALDHTWGATEEAL